MARLFVVALAARLPRWAREAREDYVGRMPRGFEVRCIDLKSGAVARVRARLPERARLVLLDERGADLTTAQFAARLQAWRAHGDAIAFVIGGPEGLDAGFRSAADFTLKLSSLTLPHAFAQVLLCEQLYRAATILSGHPYHRA